MIRQLAIHPVGAPGLIVLGLGFAAFLGAVIAARRRAAGSGRERVASEAPITWLWIAVQGLGIGAAGFGPIHVALAPGSPIALAEAALVLTLMLGAVALFDASSRAMGKNWALVARTREDHTLVQHGPFARVRHPIYVALFLFMLAMALAYGHMRNLIAAVPLYAVGTWLRIGHEERLLRAQFGAAYDAYAGWVKRFVPGLF